MTGGRPSSGAHLRPSGQLNREVSNPDVVVGEDDNCASGQVFGHIVEVVQEGCSLVLRTAVPLSEEHETRQRQTLLGKKLAEIGVGRHKDAPLVTCCCKHLIIDVPCEVAVGDVDHVMPGFGNERCKTSADALVEQEPHADVRSGTCRSLTAWAANSRAARTSSSASCGIVDQNLLDRPPQRDKPDDRGNRDAGAANARDTAHDAVIGDDARLGHGTSVGVGGLGSRRGREAREQLITLGTLAREVLFGWWHAHGTLSSQVRPKWGLTWDNVGRADRI